jgi:hypothetical protein
MLAHTHAQVLNASKLAASMGVSSHTIKRYIDLLNQTFLVRVLPPFANNLKKRLIKSPKVYIRDSGLLHCLLGIETMEELFAHPVYGSSFEGYVIENIVSRLPRWDASFFRTSNGAEIDLLLTRGKRRIALEIKSSTSPKISTGFRSSIETIAPEKAYIIAPVEDAYPVADNITVLPLDEFIKKIEQL